MDNQKEQVKKFIVDNFLFGDVSKLKDDTLLFEKGIIDSTGILELVAYLEETLNVTVKDDELVQDNFSSLNSIENYLKSKNNHSSASDVRY
jgi:acyl carrier protein